MNVEDVGKFRFCPACAAPVGKAIFVKEDPDSDDFDPSEARCSTCERPWTACPCEPRGELRALGIAVDDVFEYDEAQRVAKLMAATEESLALCGLEPAGWGSALAAKGRTADPSVPSPQNTDG